MILKQYYLLNLLYSMLLLFVYTFYLRLEGTTNETERLYICKTIKAENPEAYEEFAKDYKLSQNLKGGKRTKRTRNHKKNKKPTRKSGKSKN